MENLIVLRKKYVYINDSLFTCYYIKNNVCKQYENGNLTAAIEDITYFFDVEPDKLYADGIKRNRRACGLKQRTILMGCNISLIPQKA
ncbi:MAG: hypothetical protein J6B17_00440 [Ruminococcus sp.]|nr:hypothetical protein [Ruminococcus sp.]